MTVGAAQRDTTKKRHRRWRGLPTPALVTFYLAIALAPLAIAYAQGLRPRPFRDELASGLALVGFAMLLMEFLLSGRFRTVSGHVGIDLTMRFHQLVARSLTIFILIHPFLYATPLRPAAPWDVGRLQSLGLDSASLITGIAAWVLLPLLVITSICRDQLPYRYETWRLAHGAGALLIAVFGAHHAVEAGRYSAYPALEAFWIVLAGLAVAMMGYIYLYTPWRLARAPYRVVSVEKRALKTWEVTIEPARGAAMDFEPGQFAWLTLDRSPYSIREHPFSMSSCPADRPRISFTIKEAGDFTQQVGSTKIGSVAYLDGPHGNLTLVDREGEGLAFIAGGVGLAPIMSILRQLRAQGEPRPIRLIYGNRCAEQILYGEELEAMQRDLDLRLHHVLAEPPAGWHGVTGQLGETTLRSLLGFDGRARWLYFVCGPAPMIESVEDSLGKIGIPMGQIVSEKFSYD